MRGYCGGLLNGNLLVSRIHHFIFPGKIDPELKSPHLAVDRFWHLRMDNPGSGRHPLHGTGIYVPCVSPDVPVLDSAFRHECNRFDSPVRVRGESVKVILRPFDPEIVKHQNRVKLRDFIAAKCTGADEPRHLQS